ncbi:hypothetical protein MHYP_G00073830 [Metynnis hypsauchen]
MSSADELLERQRGDTPQAAVEVNLEELGTAPAPGASQSDARLFMGLQPITLRSRGSSFLMEVQPSPENLLYSWIHPSLKVYSTPKYKSKYILEIQSVNGEIHQGPGFLERSTLLLEIQPPGDLVSNPDPSV